MRSMSSMGESRSIVRNGSSNTARRFIPRAIGGHCYGVGFAHRRYTFQDVFNVKRGVDFTASKLRYDVITGSILENVSALQIPVYFFTGRFDYTDPTPCIVRLFDKIRAPAKKIVWFEHSAHFVFLDEPTGFAAEMRRVAQETMSQ